jgi:hypothetical protein
MSDCPHCRELERKVEFLSDLCNKKDAEIVGMQHEKLKDTREKIALRGALTKQRKQGDISRHVMAVAKMWRHWCAPRASISPSGKNVEQIRTAFIHFTDSQLSLTQRRRLLYDAVRGYALRPYDAGYGERWAAPTKNGVACVRRVTTAYIFASEERIEQGAGYWRFVHAQPRAWKLAAWKAACGVENLWLQVCFQEDRGVTRDSSPDFIEPPQVDPAVHLLLDERPEPVEKKPGPARPQLRLIEGEAA